MKQLNPTDRLFLERESERTPLHVSTLLIYDPSTAPGSRVRFKDILALFASRLHRAPIFRRVLQPVPFGLDEPYWLESADFDLEFHVRHIALPKPGDWRQLCIQVARLHARILDRDHPLWEAYVIEGLDNVAGLPEGCFAVLLKMHQAAFDAVAGTEIIAAIHDDRANPAPVESARARAWRPDPRPGNVELLSRAALGKLRHPWRAARELRSLLPTLPVLARHGTDPTRTAIPIRFNAGVGAHRVVDACFLRLRDIKGIKNMVPGATVNDVVVCIIAGALRQYLRARGELPATSLTAAMPLSVNLATKSADGVGSITVLRTSLYTDIADPLERLHQVHEECLSALARSSTVTARTLTDLAHTVPSRVAALGFRAASHSALLEQSSGAISTIIANVPGPQIPMYLCGAHLVSAASFGPVVDQVGLFHSVLSYENGISIAVTGCRDLLPDPAFYATCIRNSYAELRKVAAHLARKRSAVLLRRQAPKARRRRRAAETA